MRIGLGAVVLALALVVGSSRLGTAPDTAESALVAGSMMAFPAAVPGQTPAFAPASGPGNMALVNVRCDTVPGWCEPLPGVPGVEGPLTFTLTRLDPPGGAPAATFAASGGATLVCKDFATCDLNAVDNSVAVAVNGGGVNELVNVQACDASGACLNARIVFVQTIYALAQISTVTGLTDSAISYRCGDVGLNGLTMETVVETLVGVLVVNLPAGYGPLYGCGADTATTADNRVTMATTLGILTVEAAAAAGFPVAGFLGTPPSIDAACDAGDSIDVVDGTGTVTGSGAIGTAVGDWCDLDWADNGVVTYGLRGTGFAGVASVSAQQSGGVGPLRTATVTLTGLPVVGMTLFIDAPALLGATGADFTVSIADSDGRPVPSETVECSVSPTASGYAIIPQTGTSDSNGEVEFQVIPTGGAAFAGGELTITCFLDSNPEVRASTKVNLTMTPELETVDLVEGCNPIASTWDDGTAAEDVAAAVSPADALDGLWKFDPATGTWEAFKPGAPAAVNDLEKVDELDVIFICMSAAGTVGRPAK
jgi:hypothetical protein